MLLSSFPHLRKRCFLAFSHLGKQCVNKVSENNGLVVKLISRPLRCGRTNLAYTLAATNWASRQGFTEFVRARMKLAFHGDVRAKLTKGQEVGAGVIGGTLACWNHPFEVARIEAQTLGNMGKPVGSMVTVMKDIVRVDGVGGLFRGIAPRVCLGIWQTLFMVTGAKLIKDELRKREMIAMPEVIAVASPHEPKIDTKKKVK